MKENVYILYLVLFIGFVIIFNGVIRNVSNKWDCVEGKCELSLAGQYNSKQSCETSCVAPTS